MNHFGNSEGARPHPGKGGNTINSDTLVASEAQSPTWARGGHDNRLHFGNFESAKPHVVRGWEHDR